MGLERAAIGITVFTVFFFGVLITGGVAEFVQNGELEDTGVTQEDLQLSPNIPDVNPKEIDLKNDVVESENIEVLNASDVNNTEYSTDYVVQLENQSQQGWVLYKINGDTNYITTQVTKYGFFESSNIELEGYVTANINNTPTEEIFLSREQDLVVEDDDTNFLRFVISPSDDRIYSLTERENQQLGTLDTIGAYFASAGDSATGWFTLITQLPSILWMLGTVFGIIGVLFIIYLVLP